MAIIALAQSEKGSGTTTNASSSATLFE